MANVFDVAKSILEIQGPMTAMKLQKLVYYCQAWSLVWDERSMFPEKIEAWANGPVVPELFRAHKGRFSLAAADMAGDSSRLTDAERETVEAVLFYYGDKSSQWLSDLTHMETPWKDARSGLSDEDRGCGEITLAAMDEYYGGLPPDSL